MSKIKFPPLTIKNMTVALLDAWLRDAFLWNLGVVLKNETDGDDCIRIMRPDDDCWNVTFSVKPHRATYDLSGTKRKKRYPLGAISVEQRTVDAVVVFATEDVEGSFVPDLEKWVRFMGYATKDGYPIE